MSVTIMAAFNGALASFATTKGMEVAYENVLFTPSGNSPYLRGFLLPSMTVAAGCGPDAENIHRGHFQVDAVYEANKGWGACATMAEAIRANFKRGTTLLSGDLIIDSSYVGPGLRVEGRYMIPVTISYWAVMPNA